VHFTSEIPIRRADVLDVEGDLHALATRLRDGHPVDIHGVALTHRLLTNGAGPLYAPGDYSLRHAVRSASSRRSCGRPPKPAPPAVRRRRSSRRSR
jgi:hypothetical protein